MSLTSHPTGTPADAKVTVRAVSRTFHRGGSTTVALEAANLHIGRGEFVSLVGPSGCGKSTLLRMIAGLLRPSSGEIDIHHDDTSRSLCSVVFQEYSIFPWRTVTANVRLGLDAAGIPRKVGNARAADWIERVGLTGFAKAYPATLSGGMKQRVALARALVMEPELLLMDEPFAALDAQLRKVLQDELVAIYETLGNSVLFVTHSIEEAILLSDRIVVMSARPGRFKAEFTVPFERPRDVAIRSSAEFGALEEEIWALLRDEVLAAAADESMAGAPA
ncbi:ABC transporter ATP-binding protein [Desertimonas flava]|jgi:NitT/TauT family transport system ATP-binding protein|uniref:ABC transporter ATP-binding protein n=1 Tax=Desertimonas flava TaxID=2064846 RepID=UPI000E348B8D|nr:ABC transporter ATP-binding protein [Desertimonas flava]